MPLKELYHANSLLTSLISRSIQASFFSECYCVQVEETEFRDIEFSDTPKITSHYSL